MKILHFADLHYSEKDHDEIERCVDFMIKEAAIAAPDVIICSGDITDSQNLKLDSRSAKTLCRQFSLLADIAPVAVIIGTPSHDGKSAEILRYVRGKHNIHVSEKPEQLYLTGGRLHVASPYVVDPSNIDAIITQIPAPTKQYIQGLMSNTGIENVDRAVSDGMASLIGAFGLAAEYQSAFVPHIVNGHFQVGGAYISETQQLIGRDIEIYTDQLGMANAHLICLGHIHKQQRINDDIFYSGSIFHKDFGETDSKGFFIHEITKVELDEFFVSSTFIEVPATRKITIHADFTLDDFHDEVGINAFLESYCPIDLSGDHVRVELKIWNDEVIDKEAIEDLYLSEGAGAVVVNITRTPRETVRAAMVLELASIRDKMAEMAALRNEAVDNGVLEKADLLETTNPDVLLKMAVNMAAGGQN